MEEKEIWQPIVGYEELYEVSTYGRVRSLVRNWGGISVKRKNPYYLHQEKLHRGHLRVWLYKEGIGKRFLVHRLVAETFVKNAKNLSFVNHKDENPQNNHVENLEWCTTEYNNNYGTVKERMSKALLNRKDLSKPILRISEDGNIVEYPSMQEASRSNSLPQANIYKCCVRERHSCGGYKWAYK